MLFRKHIHSSSIIYQRKFTTVSHTLKYIRYSSLIMLPDIIRFDIFQKYFLANNNTILGCQLSLFKHFSMAHQKSSSDSPFHENTGTPASASAAATSFCESEMVCSFFIIKMNGKTSSFTEY